MRIEVNDDSQFRVACAQIDLENNRNAMYDKKFGKNNPYRFDCPWCNSPKGCLCRDETGKEYKDGSYHQARLITDCLVVA